MPKLTFALTTAEPRRWVGVLAVPKGLACACVCPGCGAALIARRGARKQAHFAHAAGYGPEGCLEGGLHLLAKSILSRAASIVCPPVPVWKGAPLRLSHRFAYQESRLEQSVSHKGYPAQRIDVLLRAADGAMLGVEIKATHAATPAKVALAQGMGLPLLEINIMDIYTACAAAGTASLGGIRAAVLDGVAHKTWCYHPASHSREYALHRQATVRPVQHSTHGGYHHYLVYGCPLRKHFVRGGCRDGQSYARIFQDCLHCVHCREIVYQDLHVGFRQIKGLPLRVHCGGAAPEMATQG